MSYQFQAGESISKGIKRIATEQIDKAIAELNDTNESDIDRAVHQARRRLKETRAVVRLVRDRLGKKVYKRENARFRDIGHGLACLRDSKVKIITLDTLPNHFTNTVEPEAFTNIRRELQDEYRQEYQRIIEQDLVTLVKHQLKDARGAIANWKIGSNDWSAIDESLERVYRRGYKGLDKAISDPTAENLHDWRKRVKYLRYHLCILSPIWTKMMEAWVDRTHELSNYLGDEHDLAVLKDFILDRSEKFEREKISAIINLIDRRRAELQSTAIILGKRIYTERPKKFVNRLGNYWQIWQSEI